MTQIAMPQPATRDSILAGLSMVLCGICVAIMTNSAKLAYQEGSNAETVLFLRALTGVCLLGVYLLIRQGRFRISTSMIPVSLVASLSSILMTYCWYQSINYLDISLSILIIFIHPLLAAYYYHFTGVTVLTRFRLFWGCAAFAGLGLALSVDFSNVSLYGLALAFAGALFATTLLITMVKLNDQVGGVTTNFHLAFWSLIAFTTLLLLTGASKWPTTRLGWTAGIGNGFAYVAAYISFLNGARLVGASRASLLSFMEPVATILLAAALFDERLSLLQWSGVALVLYGLITMEAPKGTWRRLRSRISARLSPDHST